MFYIQKDFKFSAAHQLIHHDGLCAREHGHNFKFSLTVAGRRLVGTGPKQGMLVDFGDIKAAVEPVISEYLDHHRLNDTLSSECPTSEVVASWLWARLAPVIDNIDCGRFALYEIMVEETDTSRCFLRAAQGL